MTSETDLKKNKNNEICMVREEKELNRETIVKKIKIKNKSSNTKQKILEFG